MTKAKRKTAKAPHAGVVVLRSARDGKIESVQISGADKVARSKFLRSANLTPVPKKSNLTQAKAQSAVRKYFKDHAELSASS